MAGDAVARKRVGCRNRTKIPFVCAVGSILAINRRWENDGAKEAAGIPYHTPSQTGGWSLIRLHQSYPPQPENSLDSWHGFTFSISPLSEPSDKMEHLTIGSSTNSLPMLEGTSSPF
jgi:hypothetical protein